MSRRANIKNASRMEILLRHSMPEPMSGCWLWTESLFWDGYGQFNYFEDGQWRKHRAHRVSYELHNGPFDPSLAVLHRCDLPCCVNPDHLFIGTAADNMADMDRKGRRVSVSHKGEHHPCAKLSELDVRNIRADTRLRSEIAKAYGVGWSAIDAIKSGRTWRHI